MATLTSNISNVSLTVSGTTQQSTAISWTLPTVPSGATISSCTLTGTATASMTKGSATITVNGTTVTSGTPFTINLGTGNTTSSVTATTKGNNKNASGTVTFSNLAYTVDYSIALPKYTVTFVDYDGDILKTQEVEEGSSATAPTNPTRTGYTFTGWDRIFTNVTSNLTVTAQYTIVSTLKIKNNGIWTNINKVYKKSAGIWIEQANENWITLFNSNIYYVNNGDAIPTAILYSDGSLVFSNTNIIDKSHGDVISTYTGWDTETYSSSSVPWYNDRAKIINVYFNNKTEPINTRYWFNGCDNLISLDLSNLNTNNVNNMSLMFRGCSKLTSLDLSNFDTSNVTNMGSMFSNCSKLTSLDLSNFDTSNVTMMETMFKDCTSLTSLDLSSFDMSNVTSITDMFYGCTNLQTIYVKDEAAKTKIEASSNFPTTITVIVGKPS